jgi:hypothetical protein
LYSAILIITDKLPHKELQESSLGEVADNINQVFDLLTFKSTKCTGLDRQIEFIGSKLYLNCTYRLYSGKDEKLSIEQSIEKLSDSVKSMIIHVGELRDDLFRSNSIKLHIISQFLEIGFCCYLIENKINLKNIDVEKVYFEYVSVMCHYLNLKLEKWKKL